MSDLSEQIDRLTELQAKVRDACGREQFRQAIIDLNYRVDLTDFAALAAHIRQLEAERDEARTRLAKAEANAERHRIELARVAVCLAIGKDPFPISTGSVFVVEQDSKQKEKQ